jgi:GDPmannose 4,6-dehydratase
MKYLVSGAAGQDGSYICEELVNRGDEVVGVVRSTEPCRLSNLFSVLDKPNFSLEELDITDSRAVSDCISRNSPDVFFMLAAQSGVGKSFAYPVITHETNFVGTVNCIDSVMRFAPDCHCIFPSTSDVYEESAGPVAFGSPVNPKSPYAVSKLGAENACDYYAPRVNISTVRLFNHESHRRGGGFLTSNILAWFNNALSYIENPRKNPRSAGRNIAGLVDRKAIDKLPVGNIDIVRDFSHAKDMARGLILIADSDVGRLKTDLCSGLGTPISQILYYMFDHFGLDYREFIEVDECRFRPHETRRVIGNPCVANSLFFWPKFFTTPQDVFVDIVQRGTNYV